MKGVQLHEKDVVINRDKLKELLDSRGKTYIMFYDELVKEYGIDLAYNSFMSLLGNNSSWKLLYAYAITDKLGVSIEDVFDLVGVNIEEKIEETKRWREKYQK